MQLHWNYCKRIFYAIKIYSKAHIINRIDMSVTQNLLLSIWGNMLLSTKYITILITMYSINVQ